MLFLVCLVCSSYGVLLILRLLKGCLSNVERQRSSGEKIGSETDDAVVLVQDQGPVAVADGRKTYKLGKGKAKGGFTHSNLSTKHLWIERKRFSASILLPGRKIRVTERLYDRVFTVVFKPIELSWLIVALREASLDNSGSFCKLNSFGSRSLEVKSEINRAGEFLKLRLSFGGRNSRSLFIPAGKNREGWGLLANFLAALSYGGKVWVKKSIPSSLSSARGDSFQLRELSVSCNVSSIDAVRGKGKNLPNLEDSGWSQGFLPEMLKSGLQLCLGAPSSSGEADRSFFWKSLQSEIGCGILVVEHVQRVDSLGLKNRDDMIVRGSHDCFAGAVDEFSSGEFVGVGVAEVEAAVLGKEVEDKDVFQSDAAEAPSLGNLIPKDQISILSADASMGHCVDSLAGGLSPAVLGQHSFAVYREVLSLSEQSGCGIVRAVDNHIACGLIHQAIVEASVDPLLGDIMGFGDELLGSGNARAVEDHICHISGGRAAGSDVESYVFEDKGMGSFLGNVHVRPGGSPVMRYLARFEDITLVDNVETLSFDSPACVEEGVSCIDDFCVICGSFEPCGGF